MNRMNELRARGHVENPSARLEQVFRRIEAERMADVPILNRDLTVEAVGFQEWQGHWLGILITPWFMNLMLLPGHESDWSSVPAGKSRMWRLPAGEYEFIAGFEPDLGEYHSCSLFSPVLEFVDQEAARLTAQAALAAILKPDDRRATRGGGPISTLEENLDAPMSKRDFLVGRFLRK